MRIPISQSPGTEEAIIDKYLALGPYQPRLVEYPVDEKTKRSFMAAWFVRFPWLEYSVACDSVFCFPCYLFASSKSQTGARGTFVTKGYRSWKHALEKNKGIHQHNNSIDHSQAVQTMETRKAKVMPRLLASMDAERSKNHAAQVVASAKVVMHLALQGLAFRGHDEKVTSMNRGNFLETLELLIRNDRELQSAVAALPKNAKYTSSDSQKELTSAAADIVRQIIREEIGDAYYCVVVDEARCEAKKEWMSIVIRFVDRTGAIRERFSGVIHVADTQSKTLFDHLLKFIHDFGLDLRKLRGQSFDGASNMRGEFNGLQALVRAEAPFAFYVHCYAHRLNLVIVSVASEVDPVAKFFYYVQQIFNICGASCKRNDAMRQSHMDSIAKAITEGEVATGRGLNQPMNLGSLSSTRWNCRISALRAVCCMFSSVCDILDLVSEEAASPDKRVEAANTLDNIRSFDFLFGATLMMEVLTITNTLSTLLQRMDQDLVNACAMISAVKNQVQSLRDQGFDQIIATAKQLADKHDVDVPDLNSMWQPPVRRTRRRPPTERVSFGDYYRVGVFLPVLDKLQTELAARFSDDLTEVMGLAACLTPDQNFMRFDSASILRLAALYSEDFPDADLWSLETELKNFKSVCSSHPDFSQGLNSISDLLVQLTASGLHQSFPLYCRLFRLVLTLTVTTATTERSFSALKIVKTRLRTTMGDPWLADLLLLYIEKELARELTIDSIVSKFNAMKSRRV